MKMDMDPNDCGTEEKKAEDEVSEPGPAYVVLVVAVGDGSAC